MKKEFIDLYVSSYENLITVLNGEENEKELKLNKIKALGVGANDALEKEFCNNLDLIPEVQEIIKTKNVLKFKELLKNDVKMSEFILGSEAHLNGISEAHLHLKLLKYTADLMEKESDFSVESFISLSNFYASEVKISKIVLSVIYLYFQEHFNVSSILMEIVTEKNDFMKELMDSLKGE